MFCFCYDLCDFLFGFLLFFDPMHFRLETQWAPIVGCLWRPTEPASYKESAFQGGAKGLEGAFLKPREGLLEVPKA